MSYNGIGSSIDKGVSFFDEKVNNVKDISFSSNWSGSASDNLITNLNDLLEEMNILNNNLQIYSSALKKVQEMVIIDKEIADLTSQLSGLDEEEDAGVIASINSKIAQLTKQRNSLKAEANSLLASIGSVGFVASSIGGLAGDSLYAKLTLDEKKFQRAEERRKLQNEKIEDKQDSLDTEKSEGKQENLQSEKLDGKQDNSQSEKLEGKQDNSQSEKLEEKQDNLQSEKLEEKQDNLQSEKVDEQQDYWKSKVVSPKNPNYNGEVLTAKMGILWNGPSGSETFCPDQPVGAVKIMMNRHGYSNVELYYRDDGVTLVRGVDPNGEKFEDLIAVAADLYDEPSNNLDGMFKRGDIVETSLGTAMVVDMCGRAQNVRKATGGVHFDIYTAWHDENERWYHEIYGNDK